MYTCGTVELLARDRVVGEGAVEEAGQRRELVHIRHVGDAVRPQVQGLQARQRREVAEEKEKKKRLEKERCNSFVSQRREVAARSKRVSAGRGGGGGGGGGAEVSSRALLRSSCPQQNAGAFAACLVRAEHV